jgi:hypothetical protein
MTGPQSALEALLKPRSATTIDRMPPLDLRLRPLWEPRIVGYGTNGSGRDTPSDLESEDLLAYQRFGAYFTSVFLSPKPSSSNLNRLNARQTEPPCARGTTPVQSESLNATPGRWAASL